MLYTKVLPSNRTATTHFSAPLRRQTSCRRRHGDIARVVGHFALPQTTPTSAAAAAVSIAASASRPESCSWPRSCAWPRTVEEEGNQLQHRNKPGLLERLLGPMNEDSPLPPDIESLALFADDEATAQEPASGWWVRMWRYQGPGL